MIELKPVKSSNIEAFGFDSANAVLAVKFIGSDKLHQYAGVSPQVAEGFATAESAGRYFAKYVRDQYAHEVVDSSPVSEPAPEATEAKPEKAQEAA